MLLMKPLFTSLFIFLFLLLSSVSQGQIIRTQPLVPRHNQPLSLIFDATAGTGQLAGYGGPLYAHIGVITNKSTSNKDWKYVLTEWPNASNQSKVNLDVNKFTALGGNLWQLDITTSIRDLLQVPEGEEIQKIALVVRSADGSKEGKDTGGNDILVSVYGDELNVFFQNPSDTLVFLKKGEQLTFDIASTASAELTLSVNDRLVDSKNNTTALSASYTFPDAGSFFIKATATDGINSDLKQILVIVHGDQTVQQRPSGWKDGINILSDSSVGLLLYAPGKNFIYVLGDFNEWTPADEGRMKRDGDYFWLRIDKLEADKEYGFQYLVDGRIRAGDPYCEKILDPWNDIYIPESVYPALKPYPVGKTEQTVSVFSTTADAYAWQHDQFTPAASSALTIYELHFRDFTKEGTVQAARMKLDYLQQLGVNAIELMPIQEFDGNDSWGYNPTFYFAPDKAYGTARDYKEFIDDCHGRGIGVILDVVFNHSWGESPMVKMWWDATNNKPAADNPYVYPDALHPYNVGYDLRHEEPLRNFFKQVLAYWMEEYRVDGFRFDLSKGLTTNASADDAQLSRYDAQRIAILKDYHAAIRNVNPKAWTILEHFCETREEKELAETGMMLWRNMNDPYCEAEMGYSNDLSGMHVSSTAMPAGSLVGYMESHDEQRMFYKAREWGSPFVKLSLANQVTRAKLCGLFAFLVPGPKMIWQFGELGYDVDIEENGRTGRKPVRWEYLEDADRRSLYDFYATLLDYRKRYPELFGSKATFEWKADRASSTTGRRLLVGNEDRKLLVLANFSQQTVSLTPDFPIAGKWEEPFENRFSEISEEQRTQPLSLAANAYRFFVYTDPASALNDILGKSEIGFYPNPASSFISFANNEVMDDIRIYNMSGNLCGTYNRTATVPVAHLSPGYYLLKVRKGDQLHSFKLLRQ